MTIESTTGDVTLSGDDSTTQWSLSPLKVYSSDDLTIKTIISGVYTELTEGTGSSNYSLSLSTTPGIPTLTYPADEVTPLATGSDIIAYIDPEGKQEIDLQNQTAYNAETVEKAVDLGALLGIALLSKYARSFKVPEGETASELPSSTDRADKFLAFDSSGDPTASSVVSVGELTVSAFVETLLNDNSASIFLDTLGFSSDAKTLIGNTIVQMKTQLGLGTAADEDVGAVEDNLVQLDATDKLPIGVMPSGVLNSEVTGATTYAVVELWNGITYYGIGDTTVIKAHGLGYSPDMVPICRFTCIDAGGDGSYSQNDTVYISPCANLDGTPDSRGFQLDWDATNIYFMGPRDPIALNYRETAGDYHNMAASKWKCEALTLAF